MTKLVMRRRFPPQSDGKYNQTSHLSVTKLITQLQTYTVTAICRIANDYKKAAAQKRQPC